MISRIMAPPNFPVNYNDVLADIIYQESCREAFTVGDMNVTPIPISHPNQGWDIGLMRMVSPSSF